MWVSGVQLRWYKSFNTRFEGYIDQPQKQARSWEKYEGEVFPSVEIGLDRRITTVVGANESGKSHLLSAIAKLLTGKGNADDLEQPYAIQDICRYCAFEELEKNIWPNLGIEITFDSGEEFVSCLKAAGLTNAAAPTNQNGKPVRCTAIVDGSRPEGKFASVYDSADGHVGDVARGAWFEFCKSHLPAYHYIDARMALSNEVHVNQLLAMYKEKEPQPVYDPLILQSLAAQLTSLSLTEGQPPPKEAVTAYNSVIGQLSTSVLGPQKAAMLETKLFRDVLQVPESVLTEMATFSASDRGYIERRVAEINHRLNERLDITHFWQQDDAFRLQVVYKSGFFYFEITDRTGATYTFNERSSGLRYFLSYYVQAKAIEKANETRGCIVLMDEPDMYLSVAGQRNLLRIFEALVSPKQSSGTCQLVYTTHSPFLINRNFPQRIRLVRKGDGSEGTQHVEGSLTRRYEPIRSALGIDCAETLFMGAVNIVVEGASDQKVIVGGVQRFGDPSAIDELLDLNKVTFVSAGGVSHVRRLIEKSETGDEKRPSVVVLLDGDVAGSDIYQEIIANDVLDEKFITTLDVVGLTTPWNTSPRILEDVLPPKLLAYATQRYLSERWNESTTIEEAEAGFSDTSKGDDVAKRLVAYTKEKMGADKAFVGDMEIRGAILDVFVECLLHDEDFNKLPEVSQFETNVRVMCEKLQAMIDDAEGQARRDTMHKCVRLIEERFRKSHAQSATRADVDRFINRFEGECTGPSTEARQTRENLTELRSILEQEVDGAGDSVEIAAWKRRFASLKDRPWKRPESGWK